MENILNDEIKKELGIIFSEMKDDVKIVFFETSKGNCVYCHMISHLLDEIKEQSDKIKIEKYVLEEHKDIAEKYKVDKAPAIVIVGKNKGLIRFFGIPAGHEFGAFIMTIVDASLGDNNELPEELKNAIKELKNPIHLQVFVTPSCPYCPAMARLAYLMALYNDKVIADVVEAEEFIDLSRKYRVSGVPKTIVNDKIDFLGAQPPDVFINRIKKEIG